MGIRDKPSGKARPKHAQTEGARIAVKYQLTRSTGERIGQIVSDGIKNKGGIPGISRDIRREFPDISKAKADNIAQTETAAALSIASLERMKGMGITGKEWVTAGDDRVCGVCQSNAVAGAIPVNQVFPGGAMHPPQHEGCRCVVVPVMLPEKTTKTEGHGPPPRTPREKVKVGKDPQKPGRRREVHWKEKMQAREARMRAKKVGEPNPKTVKAIQVVFGIIGFALCLIALIWWLSIGC